MRRRKREADLKIDVKCCAAERLSFPGTKAWRQEGSRRTQGEGGMDDKEGFFASFLRKNKLGALDPMD